MNRTLCLILAIALLVISFEIFLTGGVWNKYHDFFTDFGEYKNIFGIVAVLIALFFFFYAIFGKWHNQQTFIFQKCEKTVNRTGDKEVYCPKCGTKMEPLKGFYDRHPELKEK